MKLSMFACLCLLFAFAGPSVAEQQNPKNPELWICDSVNSSEKFTLYFVYKEMDYMFFSPQGGFLGAGTWDISMADNGVPVLNTQLLLNSGYRKVLMWQMADKKRFRLQVLYPENNNTTDFICH